MRVVFHGVRGSTPCHSAEIERYGGNTSCVSVEIAGHDPLLFDLGTGLRYFGRTQPHDGSFRGTCFLSHLHWDHTQGLPFFTPMLQPGAVLDVYGPAQEDGRTVADVFAETICPPLFPIGIDMFPGTFRFHDLADDDFELGDVKVRSRVVPHVGATLGYRLEWEGRSVAYISDHQQPFDGSYRATEGALDLVRGVDLLIHDSQYTVEEFPRKYNWGHCTVDYAVWLAVTSRVKRLALFHHDPTRDDDALDAMAECSIRAGRHAGVEVITAREGLVVDL
jgi:phosphoribosyl 1,2-cyclic phosphodiesterase